MWEFRRVRSKPASGSVSVIAGPLLLGVLSRHLTGCHKPWTSKKCTSDSTLMCTGIAITMDRTPTRGVGGPRPILSGNAFGGITKCVPPATSGCREGPSPHGCVVDDPALPPWKGVGVSKSSFKRGPPAPTEKPAVESSNTSSLLNAPPEPGTSPDTHLSGEQDGPRMLLGPLDTFLPAFPRPQAVR